MLLFGATAADAEQFSVYGFKRSRSRCGVYLSAVGPNQTKRVEGGGVAKLHREHVPHVSDRIP